jgi:hypothetical protein
VYVCGLVIGPAISCRSTSLTLSSGCAAVARTPVDVGGVGVGGVGVVGVVGGVGVGVGVVGGVGVGCVAGGVAGGVAAAFVIAAFDACIAA